MVATSSLIVILGIPQVASPTTIVVTPVVDLSGVESTVNGVVADVNSQVATAGTDLNSYESTLLSDADLSPAEVGALVALALIEAGGTLPDTCSEIGTLEAGIPTSILGIPLSVAELLGLTGVQLQLVANYLDNLLQTEEQTVIKDLSPAALSLLQVNYNTTFYPTAGNPIPSPVVRTTQGYIGLPSLLDVDGQPGLDLCADSEINIGSLASLVSTSELSSLGLTSLSSLSSLNSTTLLSELGSLALSGLNLSSLKIQQQITKLPLSATTMPVNINAVLPNLGSIGFGYNTQGSSAPQSYATTVQIGSNPLLGISDTTTAPGPSLTQTISLGSTLSIDNTWSPVPAAMTTGLSMSGEALSFPNTVSSPSDWTFNLPLSSTINVTANVNRLTSATASTTTMTIGTGLSASYSGGTAPSTGFNAAINLGTTGSISAGVSPLPTSFSTCYALDSISCSNVNTARGTSLTGLSSMNFVSSTPATVTQGLYVSSPAPTVTAVSPATGPVTGGTSVTVTGTGFATNPGGTIIDFGSNAAGNVVCAKTTSCTATVPGGTAAVPVNVTASVSGQSTPATAPATTYTYTATSGSPVTFANPQFSCGNALTTMYAHVTGTDIYQDYNYGLSGSTLGSGHAWLDTAGTPVSGCSTGLGLVSTYAGTTAGGSTPPGRLGTFTASSGNAPNTLTKNGAMTCPTGTSLNFSALGTLGVLVGVPSSGDVTNWLCPTPPVLTVAPVITPSGPVYIGSVLNTTSGTFTPTDMANTTTLQWYRCTSALSCTAIPGATASTYAPVVNNSVPASSDLGKTLEVIATNTNSDGVAQGRSLQTAAVALPPPPSPSTPGPVVSVTGPDALSTTNGTFISPVPVTPGWQWQVCAPPSFTCTNIVGQTSSTLTLTPGSDIGDEIQVIVSATNAGGTGTEPSNQFLVPAIPSNSVLPYISDTTQGISDTSGQDINQADVLTANSGTWSPASGVTFTYVWSHCTTSATPVCTQVGTGSTYTVAKTDVGFTMELSVTASDFSGSGAATSNKSNPVSPVSLAFQSPQSVVDGTVSASTPDGSGNTYIGGSFDTIGPGVGGAGSIAVSSATGKAVVQDAQATGGNVLAIVSDGFGGYYIGGSFTKVKGIACPSLAHITSAGSLDTVHPFCTLGLSGTVRALSVADALVAVGGNFTLGTHSNLVFLDGSGGVHASGGDPDSTNATVNAIATDGLYFYVGGSFTLQGATAVSNLAKYAVTGSGATATIAPTAWNAWVANCTTAGSKASTCITTGEPTPAVDAFSVVPFVEATNTTVGGLVIGVQLGYDVLVGGSFNTAQGTSTTGAVRNNAAAFYGDTGCIVSSAPLSPTETVAQVVASMPTVSACASATSATVNLGGWNPNANGPVRAIAAAGPAGEEDFLVNEQATPVYLGGDFTALGSTAVTGLGEFALAGTDGNGAVTPAAPASVEGVTWTAEPAAFAPATTWVPALTGPTSPISVTALAMGSDGNVYAGGNFTAVGGTVRHRIAALSPSAPATGPPPAIPTAWDPNAGNVVDALSASGTNMLVGGQFLVLGGTTYNNLAEMDSTGTVTSWNPGTNGAVHAVAFNGGNVYVGGSFTKVGGTAVTNLASVSATGSVSTSFAPVLNGPVNALTPGASFLYVGGAFSFHIATSTFNGLTAVDYTSGAPVPTWDPALGSGATVNAITLNSGGGDVYVGGAFVAGSQDSAAEFATIGAGQQPWNPGINTGAVNAIAVSGTAVYVGGNFASTWGNNLISVDPMFGGGIWGANPNGAVNALALSSDGTTVYVGGSFSVISTTPRSNLAGLQTLSGIHTSFNPGASGAVDALSLTTAGVQDTLTVSGAMQTIAGAITGGFGIFN